MLQSATRHHGVHPPYVWHDAEHTVAFVRQLPGLARSLNGVYAQIQAVFGPPCQAQVLEVMEDHLVLCIQWTGSVDQWFEAMQRWDDMWYDSPFYNPWLSVNVAFVGDE